MTREDIDKLFELLAIYRPGDRHLEDRVLRSAWLLVLEPYSPGDVKAAVAAYFRENKYFPDVTDIATRCPPIPDREDAAQNGGEAADGFAERSSAPVFRAWRELVSRRREAGIPGTAKEALEAGITFAGWYERLETAGLLLGEGAVR